MAVLSVILPVLAENSETTTAFGEDRHEDANNNDRIMVSMQDGTLE